MQLSSSPIDNKLVCKKMDVDLMELLPEDVLADVLRRLAPRWLAASRCVCRSWRDTVDSRGLLRAILPLLPRSVAGIFIENDISWMTIFLSRPSTGPPVSADLQYAFSGEGGEMYDDAFKVRGHCNGLELLWDRVVNPATRQWTRVPPRPRRTGGGHDDDDRYFFYGDVYLVFDPTVSPHYDVYSIPRVRRKNGSRYQEEDTTISAWDDQIGITLKKLDPAVEELEWPPSTCTIQVFSSETGQWEERPFVRQGPAAGTVSDMRTDEFVGYRYAVYWRGALYVQCQTDFIMRLSLSSKTYKLIQPPIAFEPCEVTSQDPRLSIGKSEKGVYSVLIKQNRMKVWILDESASNGQKTNWVSKQLDDRHLTRVQHKRYHELKSHGPWRPLPIASDDGDPESADMLVQEQFEWDSDNDDLLPDNGDGTGYREHITFLGFHPYKEVVFLNDSFTRVLAYHLNSSKIQDLGHVYPQDDLRDLDHEEPTVEASFPYTPCWM